LQSTCANALGVCGITALNSTAIIGMIKIAFIACVIITLLYLFVLIHDSTM
jgi:hypothetical protein